MDGQTLTPRCRTNFGPHDPYVLLVDDHEPSVRLLRELLSGAGIACVSTTSAASALAQVDERRPWIIVTDLSMPNLDGRGLATWIKSRHPSLPLILLTGELLDGEAIEVLKLNFTAVLSKPLDLNELLLHLDRLLPAPAQPV